MSILTDLRQRVATLNEALRTGELVRNALVNRGDEIMRQQRIQLLEGKSSTGLDLRPFYSEDLRSRGGWFLSGESAARYAAWKKDGIDYPYSVERNPDAPNLYINGKFHSELGVEFRPDSVAVIPLTTYALGIVAKYGLQNFGLMSEKWREVFESGAFSDVMNSVKQIVYGK